MTTVLTYWQVYLILAVSALAAFWFGWACCLLARPAGRHRGTRAVPLPGLPAAAAAAIDARHANVMAAAAPREPSPLARARARVAAAVAAIGALAAARQAWETDDQDLAA